MRKTNPKIAEELKEALQENIKSYNGYELMILNSSRVNVDGEAVVLKSVNSNKNVYPQIYMKRLLDEYQEVKNQISMDEFAKQIIEFLIQSSERANESSISKLFSEKDMKDTIFNNAYIGLMNKEKNKHMLSEIPYVDFLDLVQFIYFEVNTSHGSGIIKITNNILESIGITKDELFEIAKQNMINKTPVKIKDVENMLLESFPIRKMNTGLTVAITNDECYGASAILFAKEVVELMNVDSDEVYIIPSSLHEILLIEKDKLQALPSDLAEMIYEINRTDVVSQDFLSDNLYVYNKNTNELKIVIC